MGRKEQFEDPSLCHAAVGADKAARFLDEQGYAAERVKNIAACIRSHRYRSDAPPESLEAKILFDADKLDVAGALGCARTLLYHGELGEPLYCRSSNTRPCFFHEYKRKLEKLYDGFLTYRGKELALCRQQAAIDFYNALYAETLPLYDSGQELLLNKLT